MFDLRTMILDRCSREDLENALIRKSRKDMSLFDRQLYSLSYDTESIERKIDDRQKADLFRECFKATMNNVHDHTSGLDVNRRLLYLRSFRKIVSLDLAYSYMSQFVYRKEVSAPQLCLPSYYIDSDGKKQTVSHRRETIDIAGRIVVETPYDPQKWVRHLAREDVLDAERYEAGIPRYYPELNLLIQGSGSIHRTAEAFLTQRNGTAEAHVYDDSVLYGNIETDGAVWIGKHTGESLEGPLPEIQDFRLAVVFSLRCEERELEGHV